MKEVIPNSISSVLIMATTNIGNQILMFSTLSFLGLGSAPPTPEWGMMVSDAGNSLRFGFAERFNGRIFPGHRIHIAVSGGNDGKVGDFRIQVPVSYTHLDVYKRQDNPLSRYKLYPTWQ